MISRDKKDLVYNALLVGMELHDAYIFAGMSESEILEASEDVEFQATCAKNSKVLEYTMLEKLNEVIEKQVHMGKENAITWVLEHTNPRYSGKPQNTMPDIHLHIDSADPATYDNVTIKEGVK
jgi:hypothetical protein